MQTEAFIIVCGRKFLSLVDENPNWVDDRDKAHLFYKRSDAVSWGSKLGNLPLRLYRGKLGDGGTVTEILPTR